MNSIIYEEEGKKEDNSQFPLAVLDLLKDKASIELTKNVAK
jgi:hypothetical protein